MVIRRLTAKRDLVSMGAFRPYPTSSVACSALDGTEYTFHVPFDGDPEVFKCAPSTFTTSGPPMGVVGGHELALTYTQLNHDADGLKANLASDLDKIEQHLQWVSNDVGQFRCAFGTMHRA